MIKFLRKFFGLCEHKWKIIETFDIGTKEYIRGIHYVLQCENCGNLKGKKFPS